MPSITRNEALYNDFFVDPHDDLQVGHLDYPPRPNDNDGGFRTSYISAIIQETEDLALRIIFLPLDLPERNLPANHPRGLKPLFTHYDIPSDFIAERVYNVAHGSGSSVSQDDVYCN